MSNPMVEGLKRIHGHLTKEKFVSTEVDILKMHENAVAMEEIANRIMYYEGDFADDSTIIINALEAAKSMCKGNIEFSESPEESAGPKRVLELLRAAMGTLI